MGWRAAKASGNASMPVDTGGSFAEGFASTFVPMFNAAVSDYASEQREKRMLELKEELLRKRASITSARTAATDASKLAREEAEMLRTARGVAESLGIMPTEANLNEVVSAVRANDGDGSQATNYLQERMSTGSTVFEQGTVAPTPSAAPPAPVEDVEDDTGAALDLPATEEADPVEQEMSSLENTGLMSDKKNDGYVQVASLNADAIMAEVAAGGSPAESQEAGEELAVKVADASGNVEGAETLTYDSPELSTANTAQRAGVLKFTGLVTPINQISDEDTLNANLIALEGRTDSFAVDYRIRAQQLLEALTDLPDIATMERSQRQAYIDGGWREFEGKVPEENLMAHLQRATSFQQSGQAMPPIPASLAEQEALMESIQSGVYGTVANIPPNYTANLSNLISRNQVEEQLGDALSVPNLLNNSIEDLDALQAVLKGAGVQNSTVSSLLTLRKTQANNAEFSTYSEGVDTSLEAINQISRAQNLGASAETIEALESLRDTLINRENEKAARDNGAVATPVMAIVPSESGSKVVREVVQNADGTYTGADGQPLQNVRQVSDTFIEQWSSIETEHSTLVKTGGETLLALSEGLRNAQNVVDIVVGNPEVLTLGGDVAQVVTQGVRGAASVMGVVSDLMEGKGDDYRLSASVLDQELASRGLVKDGMSFTESGVNALVSPSVQNLAADTSLFEGQMILLAFRMGALEGQSGNAMSNKDFDRLMSIISSSNGSEETFRAKIHEYMQEKIQGYDDRAVIVNRELDSFEETFSVDMSDLVPSFGEFVTARNDQDLTSAYQFFSEPLAAGSSRKEPPNENGGTQLTYEDLVNNQQALGAIASNYNILKDSEDETVRSSLETYLGFEARKFGMTAQQLRTLLDNQEAGDQ